MQDLTFNQTCEVYNNVSQYLGLRFTTAMYSTRNRIIF